MSDEATSSASVGRTHSINRSDDVDEQDGLSPAELSAHRKRIRALFNRKRVELFDDLIRNLDILVYAELSIIYYMDCHLFRFILRAIVQFMFLTPKPAAFPQPPKPEPYIGAIAGTNVLCLLLHVLSEAPAAGEATRFYLHGGLLLDFIGQKGPSSKVVLILLDVFVVTLQMVHLSAHITRKKLKDGAPLHPTAQPPSAQDVDSEERGVRRSAELQQQEIQENIELQTLSSSGRATTSAPEGDLDQERRAAALESTAPRLDAFLLESFWNGQIVLADLNPLNTAREQIVHYQQTPVETRRSALNAQLSARMSEFRYMTRRR